MGVRAMGLDLRCGSDARRFSRSAHASAARHHTIVPTKSPIVITAPTPSITAMCQGYAAAARASEPLFGRSWSQSPLWIRLGRNGYPTA